MRILQLCHKPPKPPKDGGCMAINTLSEGLLELGADLHILTLSTHKHPFETQHFDATFLKQTKIKSVYVDTKPNVVDAFSNLVTADSYNVSRFFSTDFDKLLQETLQANQYDIIHLESLFMTVYNHTIRRFSAAKIVLRSHNLEYMIWQRLAKQNSNPAKRFYLKLLAKQLKRYEMGVFNTIDGIAAISDDDHRKYKKLAPHHPMITIPFGIQTKAYQASKTPESPSHALRFFHIGAMDWKPNLEGVIWFLEDIWPHLYKATPEARFTIGGRKMPDWLLEVHHPGVENRGEVPDAKAFMAAHDVLVVPLLSAGGMRIKIIEGMAMGNVVLTTRIGAEGIDCEDRKHCLIANTRDEFVQQIQWLQADPKRANQISKNARKLVAEKYDNRKIIKDLLGFYQTLQAQ